MNYKKLGKSGVEVSELILGCWAMGGDYFGATEDESSLEALQVSYENGVNTLEMIFTLSRPIRRAASPTTRSERPLP